MFGLRQRLAWRGTEGVGVRVGVEVGVVVGRTFCFLRDLRWEINR